MDSCGTLLRFLQGNTIMGGTKFPVELKQVKTVTSDPHFAEEIMSLLCSRTGMTIGSKLLSEQPARDRAEHGALRNAVHLQASVCACRCSAAAYLYYFTPEIFKLWYASV